MCWGSGAKAWLWWHSICCHSREETKLCQGRHWLSQIDLAPAEVLGLGRWVFSQHHPVLPGGISSALFFLGHKSTTLFQGAQPDACFWPQVVTKFICVSDPGSLPEELVVTRKSEALETAQPAAENQETLHGQSSSTSSLRQSSEHSPTVEQAPASEVHMGPAPAVKTEQERLEMKTISPEGSCSQQEIQKAKPEEGSCVKDAVRKKS